MQMVMKTDNPNIKVD